MNQQIINLYLIIILFTWKLFLNDTEITNDENNKEFFITSTNESFFGITKKVFENKYNKNFNLSLDIKGEKNYSDKISLIIIDSFEYENGVSLGEI